MLIVLIFICGLFCGSIIEWIAWKVPKEEKGDKLRKGIFKYIKKLINKRTIVIALIGVIYCIFYLKYGISIDFFKYCTECSVLLLIAFIDYRTKYVYFSTILTAAVLNFMFIGLEFLYRVDVKTYIMGAVFALVVSIILSSLKVFGWGDVEIFFVCGLLTGLNKTVIIMLTSIVICGLYGIYLMIKERKILKKMRVAFGPYIVATLLFTIIFLK
ncbi:MULTISPECIES: prepilin peptidase [Clostridium]|uniref:prepilin peptidase n=1 Tax=Clostridium TaxID=1485 RepID=UPI000824D4BB|nr:MULTISPECIES: A24 family peptidase [Clostridium]PJI06575.1 prepilin peptidase [Clostridium sp. CT7]